MIQWMSICSAADLSFFDTQLLNNANFFDGVIRRDLKGNEIFNFFKINYDDGSGPENVSLCTGFRVLQKKNRFLIATSRHCFKYTEEEACRKNLMKIVPMKDSDFKFIGTCHKIIVSSEKDDLFIMEINIIAQHAASVFLESAVKEAFPAFKLAAYTADVGAPLVMFGFPTDPTRRGRPTVTENCEVMPSTARDGIYFLPPEEQQILMDKSDKARLETPPQILEMAAKLEVVKLKHNCSVYNGNSGGPILVQGSKDVLGIPFDYWPEFLKSVPKTYARSMESVAEFVRRHRKVLDDEGIEISEKAPPVRLRVPALRKKLSQSI